MPLPARPAVAGSVMLRALPDKPAAAHGHDWDLGSRYLFCSKEINHDGDYECNNSPQHGRDYATEMLPGRSDASPTIAMERCFLPAVELPDNAIQMRSCDRYDEIVPSRPSATEGLRYDFSSPLRRMYFIGVQLRQHDDGICRHESGATSGDRCFRCREFVCRPRRIAQAPLR